MKFSPIFACTICFILTASPAFSYSKDELLGKVNVKNNTGFAAVPARYSSRSGLYLRADAQKDFILMAEAAARDGIKLSVISAFRSFDEQKSIWEAKWHRYQKEMSAGNEAISRKILLFSSMPGTSRHHWGTEVDLNSLENSYFEQGYGKKVLEWLNDNAHKYQFFRPYTPKGIERPYGYEEERWHWSYLPLARPMLVSWTNQLSDYDIKGFTGSETALQVGMVKHYILGISPDCLPYD